MVIPGTSVLYLSFYMDLNLDPHVCAESALIHWAICPDLFSSIPSIGGIAFLFSSCFFSSFNSSAHMPLTQRCVYRLSHWYSYPLPTKLLPYCFTFMAFITVSNYAPPLCCLFTLKCSFREKKRHWWEVNDNNVWAAVGVNNVMLNEWMSFGFKGKLL